MPGQMVRFKAHTLLALLELPLVFLGGARQHDFISRAPEVMSSWGLKYYPLCGFHCGQVLNKRHVRKNGSGKADNLGFTEQGTKDPRTRCWLGYLSSAFSLSFPFSFFFWRGWRVLVFNPGAFINLLGPPFVCVTRAVLLIPFGH